MVEAPGHEIAACEQNGERRHKLRRLYGFGIADMAVMARSVAGSNAVRRVRRWWMAGLFCCSSLQCSYSSLKFYRQFGHI